VAGTKNRARKPRDYVVTGAWPYATIDYHAARVAQAFARRLEELMRRRQLSAKRLAAASTVNRQTIANVLAGKVWPGTMTMANLEAAVGIPLYPALDDEDVVNPPSRPPTLSPAPGSVSPEVPAPDQLDAGLIAEIEELFLGHRFAAAPWRIWLGAEGFAPDPDDREEPATDVSEQLQVLEHVPFLHPCGVLTSLYLLAEEAGWAVRETVLALRGGGHRAVGLGQDNPADDGDHPALSRCRPSGVCLTCLTPHRDPR
jgi:transcriptional regulator with XRE-family HTH domain